MSSFQPIAGLASFYAVSKPNEKDTADKKQDGCIRTKTRTGPCVSPDPRKFFPEDKKQRPKIEPTPVRSKNGSSADSDVQPE